MLGIATVFFVLLFAGGRSLMAEEWTNIYLGLAMVPLLLFVPGASILRIMRIHRIGFTRSALYSLGLGVMVLMIIGALLNVLHYTGPIDNPLTLWPICGGFVATIILLLAATYRRDRDYVVTTIAPKIDVQTLLVWAFGILLPIVVVVGTQVAGFEGDRSIIFFSLVAMCAAPLIVLSKNTKNYEVLVLSLSLSILLHRGLMTSYLMGYDVFSEYYTAVSCTSHGYWDVFREFGANTAMSMCTLAPMLTNLTSIETIELLKIVYPIIFSFTALAVYKVVQGQLGARPALAASFLYIGYQAFYGLMVQLTKQQMAEVFLLMFFMCVTDRSLSRRDRRIFALISLFGIVVSHYALAYIAIGLVVGLVAMNTLWHLISKVRERLKESERAPIHRWFIGTVKSWYHDQRRTQIISVDLALAFLAIFVIWFSITASGMMLKYGENVEQYVGSTSGTESFLTQMDSIEFVLIDYGSPLHNVEKYLILFSMAICIIGVAYAITRFDRLKEAGVERDFVIFGALASLIIIGCFTIPRLSYSFYFARFFQVTYIFTSGFFVLGLFAIVNFFLNRKPNGIGILKRMHDDRKTMKVASAFLVLFLMFNTGAVYYATDDYSSSFALDPDISWSVYSDSDVLAAKWVGSGEHHGSTQITADWHRFPIFAGIGASTKVLNYQWTKNQTDTLLYLSTWNVQTGWTISSNRNGSSTQTYTPISDILGQIDNRTEVVYSTGGQAMIVYVPPSEPETNPVGPMFHTYEDAPIYVLSGAAAISILAVAIVLLFRRSR